MFSENLFRSTKLSQLTESLIAQARIHISMHGLSQVSFPGDDFHVRLQHGSVEVYKGYTKATAMMFIAALCAELDIDADWELVRPFIPALDKLFLVPVHAAYLRTAQLYFHLLYLSA